MQVIKNRELKDLPGLINLLSFYGSGIRKCQRVCSVGIDISNVIISHVKLLILPRGKTIFFAFQIVVKQQTIIN
jgi:hypothetical protein